MANSPKKSKAWIHPIHARGIKSPQFDGSTGPLTDRKITSYILEGKYGEEARDALIAERARKKLKPVSPQKLLAKLLKSIGL